MRKNDGLLFFCFFFLSSFFFSFSEKHVDELLPTGRHLCYCFFFFYFLSRHYSFYFGRLPLLNSLLFGVRVDLFLFL
ncbi:hypothetical protein V8C35DRAFT_70480 [Trichoderma chlorosporum]